MATDPTMRAAHAISKSIDCAHPKLAKPGSMPPHSIHIALEDRFVDNVIVCMLPKHTKIVGNSYYWADVAAK